MGGTTFYNEEPADKPIDEAFARAVDQAAWEHGHGGYTGTIAEKRGYVEFTIPDGMTGADVLNLIRNYSDSGEWDELSNRWVRKPIEAPKGLDLDRLFQVYDDKWGPAVAFRSGDKWVFCGWASC